MRLPRLIAVGVAGAALAGSFALPAGAVTATSRPSALEVSAGPVRQQVTGRPGVSVPVHFQLNNIGTQPIVVTAREGAFTETSAGRMEPAPIPPGEADWLRLPSGRWVIQPQQSISVTGQLVLPSNAQPGDADLAAAFTARPGSVTGTGAGAGTVPVVLAEVIVHVPGKAVSDVRYSLAAGGLSWGGPVSVTATVHEAGNVYALLNHQAITGLGRVPLPGMLLLSGTTRTVSASVQPGALCLPCTIHYGNASAHIWSLPGLPILGIVLVILGGTGVFLFLRRNHRKAAARRHGPKPLGGPTLKGTHAR